MAYDLGAFDKIVGVNFGAAWLLMNLDIGGFLIDGPAPPFGTFSFVVDPKSGIHALEQTTVEKKQTNVPANNDLWFPWPDIKPQPTISNYNTLLPDVLDPPPEHVYSVVNGTGRFWPDDPTMPSPNNQSFWYDKTKVILATAFLNSKFDFPIPGDSYPFTDLDGSHELFPLPVHFSSVFVTVVHSQGNTNFNIKALYSVPANKASLQVKWSVPANSTGAGWASIFTKQAKAVSKVSDIKGTADQSVYFPGIHGGQTITVTTTGKKGKGTVSIPGQIPQTPGLPATAPFSPT